MLFIIHFETLTSCLTVQGSLRQTWWMGVSVWWMWMNVALRYYLWLRPLLRKGHNELESQWPKVILYILFNLHINPDVIERGLQLSGEKTNSIPPQDWLFCQAWMSKLYLLFRIIICTWWVIFIHTTINSYYLL